MKNSYYITTPIYYVNDVPHIGHAYTSLACDVVARFKRLDNFDVWMLTGTDEHGKKISRTAKNLNTTPKELVDKFSESFRKLTKTMNLSNDDFIRTIESRHKVTAQKIWNKLLDAGHIYKSVYEGWYAVSDEMFVTENEITTLENGKKITPLGTEVEWMKEESYFFNLSQWQKPLLKLYKSNPNFIQPKQRYNEVVSFVEGGLQDLSISRTSFDWGVKVPNDDKHVMYVWLDALTNYLSAIEYTNEDSTLYKKYWPADVHVVGKDIVRFHAVYWPAFLMAANIPLPKKIFAHGWWTNEKQKISKSKGNVIVPEQIIEQFGLDPIRYFLLREMTFGNDGDFSKQRIYNRNNTELANELGNLSQRVLSMVFKNCNAEIPPYDKNLIENPEHILSKTYNLVNDARSKIENLAFDDILKNIFNVIKLCNSWINEQEPWNLKKENPDKMNSVLYILCEAIRNISILLLPFMPDSMNKMLDQLNIPLESRNFSQLNKNNMITSGIKINKPQVIFLKFNEEE